MAGLRVPSATYRIQFSLNFRYVDGRDLVPYLNDLGITDLYSSPRFKARRGSPHAYDVTNPLRINSELGTEGEFNDLANKLKAYGMGLVLDVVPNHMATGAENPWWMDVLENGRRSLYASHFAIDWDRGFIKSSGKVVLPILGDLYGNVLLNQEFSLKLDENGFFVRYYDHRLPLDPNSYAHILTSCARTLAERGQPQLVEELERLGRAIAELPVAIERAQIEERHHRKEALKRDLWRLYNASPEFKTALEECLIALGGARGELRSFDALDRILSDQAYRVAYWRMAAEELNYRRFFDITDLIGVRVEDPEVFDSRHPEIEQLVRNGMVSGLRVDHIDGLFDPQGYLERLREKTADGGFYVIVEKILASREDLPHHWPTAGTTGYDFLGYLNSLFVDPEGLKQLTESYSRFAGMSLNFQQVRHARKKQVLEDLFRGELRALGFHLNRLAAQDWFARDLPLEEMVRALVEVIAWLPVYRTYVRDYEVPERARAYLEQALEHAERTAGNLSPGVFGFLRRVLLLEIPHYVTDRLEWLNFLMDWQQFTGPVMAKGFEDTACYVYNRLISQNEVGSDPEIADQPADIAEFHRRNQLRLENWPHTLNASSTHDTKRSEDVRARINALSEIPVQWGRKLGRWSAANEAKKLLLEGRPVPHRNEEVMLYQTMLGAWPLCEEEVAGFAERLKSFMQKAAREAKTHTNWLRPNEDYENALAAFTDAILEPSPQNAFLGDFLEFQPLIARCGARNSLSQTLLKITSPGVPDFYQGTELWDFSLVDPDNRRPVDFSRRVALLEQVRRDEGADLAGLLRDLAEHWQDGRIKLYLTYKALNFRRAQAELFQRGQYLPVEAGTHACAFARRLEDRWALVVAPRLAARLGAPRKRLHSGRAFGKQALALPPGAPERWQNVLTGENLRADGGNLALAALLARFPVALLGAQPPQ